ncbi:V-type ATP synthase subunit D [Halobacteriaceae archaeon GCM10025711]
MKDNVTPTRHNLMRLQHQLDVATKGHDTLERKRDRLILELMDLVQKERAVHGDLEAAWERAERARDRAYQIDGHLALESAAEACSGTPEVLITTSSLLGVRLPQIESRNVRKTLADRGYGIIGTSTSIDETAESHEALLEQVIVTAEIEAGIKRLLDEIQRTMVKVRALEHRLIPDLETTIESIQFHLDEREREERIRQFYFKRRFG